MPDPVTGRWKRPRPEHAEGPAQHAKDTLDEVDHLPHTSTKRVTSATATLVETNPSHGILDELAERLGSFHESARTLASCLQKHDVTRKTIEAAKCRFLKLLEEASDDLERVTPRSRENLSSCPETSTRKLRSRFEVPIKNSVWRTSTDTPMPQSLAESLEQVVEGDPRKQLELSVSRYELVVHYDISNLLFTEAEHKGKTRNYRVIHWSWMRRLECRQAVS